MANMHFPTYFTVEKLTVSPYGISAMLFRAMSNLFSMVRQKMLIFFKCSSICNAYS